MTQPSAKLDPWRVTIVCLTILTFAASTTIAFAPEAKPIRDDIGAYATPTLEFTSKLARTIALGPISETWCQNCSKGLDVPHLGSAI